MSQIWPIQNNLSTATKRSVSSSATSSTLASTDSGVSVSSGPTLQELREANGIMVCDRWPTADAFPMLNKLKGSMRSANATRSDSGRDIDLTSLIRAAILGRKSAWSNTDPILSCGRLSQALR
jgi:hypothetical protein